MLFHINDQQGYEKILNVINHHRNINQNQNECVQMALFVLLVGV